jgi:D-aminoacyl-tRNA deacylase
MRVVIQRVVKSSVTISGKIHASIEKGLLILLGVETEDNISDVEKLAAKIVKLRIFGDENDQMNLSNADVNGDYLVVSQFTLYADTKKGNRPSYIKAARPEQAIPLYEKFVELLKIESGKEIKTGVFGADMKVELINDGPVTIIMDTKEW